MSVGFNGCIQEPESCPIKFVAGDDFKVAFQVLDEQPDGTDKPVDITNFEFRAFIDTGSTRLDATTIKGPDGAFVVWWKGSQTENHRPGRFHWHLIMTDDVGERRTLILDVAEIEDHAHATCN